MTCHGFMCSMRTYIIILYLFLLPKEIFSLWQIYNLHNHHLYPYKNETVWQLCSTTAAPVLRICLAGAGNCSYIAIQLLHSTVLCGFYAAGTKTGFYWPTWETVQLLCSKLINKLCSLCAAEFKLGIFCVVTGYPFHLLCCGLTYCFHLPGALWTGTKKMKGLT